MDDRSLNVKGTNVSKDAAPLVVTLIIVFAGMFVLGAVLISDEWDLGVGLGGIIGIGLAGVGFLGLVAAAWHGTRKSLG
jgi:hypothetical protein